MKLPGDIIFLNFQASRREMTAGYFERAVYSLFILILFTETISGQRYGLPGIHNFTRQEYNGGTQNWSFGQSPNGMVYFGNNNGLLEFDGAHWSIYSDLGLINRSLCIDGKRIYVGAFNKFGYYEEDDKGKLKYCSLMSLLNGRMTDFDEIWRIYKTSYGIVFQSFKAIFIYENNKIEIVYPRTKFNFSFYVNGILWIYDEGAGLMQLREGKVRQLPLGSYFIGKSIGTILPLNDDQIIVGTAKDGLYKFDGQKFTPWNKPVNDLLKENQIFSGSVIDKKYFAFGTIQNGLFVSDTSGRVIFHINKEHGLLNNTILCVGSDLDGNIWLGLDNGISVVHFNSALTYIQDYFDIGSGYASVLYENKLYLGTNQGLFYINWIDFINPLKKKQDFHLIEGTEGQVWSLNVLDNTLLCGHHTGVFQIRDKNAIRISSVSGGWTMMKMEKKSPLILVGTYSGLTVLEKRGQDWAFRNELKGFNESSRSLKQDEKGYIWISHGYKGLFRLMPDADMRQVKEVKFYNSGQGLPSDFGNTLLSVKSGIVVGSTSGLYKYNEKTDRFVPDIQFDQLLPGIKKIDYLALDQLSDFWFITNQQLGVLRFQEDGSYKNISAPFIELSGKLIPTFGHVNSLDANNVIIGLEGGFAHYNSLEFKQANNLPVLFINNFQSSDTSEGSYRFNSACAVQAVVPRFKYSGNTVKIAFAANQYASRDIEFQYKLNGFDDKWSEWSVQNLKEYTNLPEGDYIFKLKARTIQGMTTPVLNYHFKILAPWYRTIYALVIYLIIFFSILYILYKLFVKRLERSHFLESEAQKKKYREREQILKEEALIAEKEMINLRNEKLSLEMIHKEKELANSTMIIQKNEILQKLKNDLSKIKNSVHDDHQKNDLGTTIKRIGKEIDNEKQWQVFNTHVEQVHQELFKKLKKDYPDLTPRELSLCAYLRMNISSKEIATLMNISTRGVEISRYRIRKKLGLDRNANLTEFMLTL